jgi:signal transduction histidine kinase
VAAVPARAAAADSIVSYLRHEARNTLTAILGFCDIIESEALGPMRHSKYRQYVTDIKSSAMHLSRVLEDSLDSSLPRGNELRLSESCVELASVAATAATMASGLARKARVRLKLDLGHASPRAWADATKLRQVVLNLLTNGIKYTPAGGRVSVAVRRTEDGGAAIVVRDTGLGMSDSELDRAFEPYVRHSAALALDRPGTGLGLFLTRRLVAAHGGRIEIASVPGRGTSVTVVLPRDRVASCAVCSCPLAKVA